MRMDVRATDHEARRSLAGKTAVVTGGHRGIGRDITLGLAAAGADVLIIDRYGGKDSDIPSHVASLGRNYYSIQADLADARAVEHAAEQAKLAVGRIDILVNNAGISRLAPLEDLSVEDWDATMAVNVRAPFLLTCAFARGEDGMLARGSGTVVNVSSVAATGALFGHGAYCSSKAAVSMLTRMMTTEWAGRGIRANAVAPTVVLTEMGKQVWGGEDGREMLKRIPQGRFVEPFEVADAVVYLASDAASMVNGAVLPVEGGLGCM